MLTGVAPFRLYAKRPQAPLPGTLRDPVVQNLYGQVTYLHGQQLRHEDRLGDVMRRTNVNISAIWLAISAILALQLLNLMATI